MAIICHGNGDLARDGCCYIAGEVCPLRWKVVDGSIYEGPDLTPLGTVAEMAATYTNNPNLQQRVIDQVQSTTFLCSAAIDVIANDTKLVNDRAGLEAAWLAHPDYVAQVAPLWREAEQAAGLAAGTLDCPSWTGSSGGRCCFAEDQATNDAKSAPLSADAKTVRQAGGV